MGRKDETMYKNSFMTDRMTALMGGFLGVLAFLLIYGTKVINPRYVDWLLVGGDLSQHYLGWELFRLGDWHFPIGMSNGYSDPYAISIIFTDSIPLFAVPFKLLCKGMSGDFQYFGFWGLFCFFLQGYWAVKVLQRVRLSHLATLVGSILFILSPFMVQRMYWHSALAAHFVLLMGLWLFLSAEEISVAKATGWWLLVGMLCASIHLYYLAMCGCLLGAFWVRRLLAKEKQGTILIPFAYCFGAVLILFILGAFHSGMDAGAPGIGYYSFNLNGFFRPNEGWSKILPPLATFEDGQYEGFSYLGLGALVLLVLGGIMYLFRSAKREMISGLIFAFVSIVVSASNEVCFGNHLLFRYDVPDLIMRAWSPFRSSGRLIWPLAYYLIYVGIAGMQSIHIQKLFRQRVAGCLLVLAVLLQIVDLQPKLSEIRQNFTKEMKYENPVYEEVFERIEAGGIPIRHLVYLDRDRYDLETQYGFCRHAIKRGMTVNDFYFARNLTTPTRAVAFDCAQHAQADCLFVIPRDVILETYGMPLHWYQVGGDFYGLRDPLPEQFLATGEIREAVDEQLTSQRYILKEDWLMGGYMDGDTAVLPAGAYCFGPYYVLPEGNYEVTVIGEDLDEAQVTVSKDAAAAWLDSRLLDRKDASILFEFSLKERTKQVEFRIDNCGKTDMKIRGVVIRRK